MWSLYTGAGYRGDYKSIKEIYDEDLESCYMELELIKKNNLGYMPEEPEILNQPFPNNEHVGKFTGEMFSFLNKKKFCIFKIPEENTKMHIVALTHMNNETHYLIRTDVCGYYFGDEDWEIYNNA